MVKAHLFLNFTRPLRFRWIYFKIGSLRRLSALLLILASGALLPAHSVENSGYSAKMLFYTGVVSPVLELYQKRIANVMARMGIEATVKHESAARALQISNNFGDGEAGRVFNLKKIVTIQLELQ